MRLYHVQIEGQTPLLMKRKVREFITRERLSDDHPIRQYIKGEAITAQDLKRDEVQRAIADFSAYRNGCGMYMPAIAMRHSLIEGARKGKVKVGRSGIWRYLSGTVFPSPAEIPITRNGATIEMYDRLKDSLVRGTSGVVLQYQAEVQLPWKADFQLLVLDDNFAQTTLEEVVYAGGLYAGLGAWVSGGFGRYSLASFEAGELPGKEKVAGLLQPA